MPVSVSESVDAHRAVCGHGNIPVEDYEEMRSLSIPRAFQTIK